MDTTLFFVAITLSDIVSIFKMRQLIKRPSNKGGITKKQGFMWAIHIVVCLFIFIPAVLWPIMAFPVAVAIPATLTMGAALYGCFHVSVEHRANVLIIVVGLPAMWICYALYEQQMQIGAVMAPVRIDLEIIAPLLYYSNLLLFRFVRGTTTLSKSIE